MTSVKSVRPTGPGTKSACFPFAPEGSRRQTEQENQGSAAACQRHIWLAVQFALNQPFARGCFAGGLQRVGLFVAVRRQLCRLCIAKTASIIVIQSMWRWYQTDTYLLVYFWTK